MKQLEYLIEKNVSKRKLAEFGKIGWELVSVVDDGWNTKFYFKREINKNIINENI